MFFISQKRFENNCGAFAIAYWRWLVFASEGYKSVRFNDRSYVDEIYSEIQFGADNHGFHPEFSNPKKMVDYINRKFESHTAKLIAANTFFWDQFPKNEFGAYYYPGGVLPDLQEGQYAILVVGPDPNMPTHYVLVHRGVGGIEVTDPQDGITRFFNCNISQLGTVEDFDFDYSNTQLAIYIC
jgi:hypothetical protein